MDTTLTNQAGSFLSNPGIVLSLVANVIAFITAIAAWYSARASGAAAQETRRSTQAIIMSALLDAYASDEMLSAMITLRRWKSQFKEDFVDEFRRTRKKNYSKVQQVDEARRRVSHFFQKIHSMWKAGLLDETTVRSVATKGQVEFYREINEGLEFAVNSTYEQSSFEDLGSLYGIPKSIVPMANP